MTRPVLSVGAVVFREDDVLLVRRGRAPLKGCWSIPGGKVEYGETVDDAIHREVFEETSIRCDIIGLIDIFEALPEESGADHYVMVDYAARWRAGEPIAGDDADDAAFVPIDEALARLSWDKTRTALAQALELYRRACLREAWD